MPCAPILCLHQNGYIALTAFVLNLVVVVVLTLAFRALRLTDGADETKPADYRRRRRP